MDFDRRMPYQNQEQGTSGDSEDNPPHSRLFVICNKANTETDIKDAFSKYGDIEYVKLVKNRTTGENKGVAYVKYYKTSEAATALEEMHGKTLGSYTIKVMVAASKASGNVSSDDDLKYRRLFVIVSKEATKQDLQDEFSKYGRVEGVNIIRDKVTSESKGYAYITYKSFLSAAVAFESAEKKYKAIFASPKPQRPLDQGFNETGISKYGITSTSSGFNFRNDMFQHADNGDRTGRVMVVYSPMVTPDQIGRLLDLIPGFRTLQTRPDTVRRFRALVAIFATEEAAFYARDKLDGFEYPPGQKLSVKIEDNFPAYHQTPLRNTEWASVSSKISSAVDNLASGNPDLTFLAETIAKASSLLKAAAENHLGGSPRIDEEYPCSVPLPPKQPLASIDSSCGQRCFIVCQPRTPPVNALRDIFCRFGNLISVYIVPNKTVGYVKYATAESAQEAMRVLHGAEVCGVRLKVLEAEERGDYGDQRRKRAKIEVSE